MKICKHKYIYLTDLNLYTKELKLTFQKFADLSQIYPALQYNFYTT